MSILSRIPILRFGSIVNSNGGISRKGIFHLAPWVLKTTLLEPLRWFESIRYNKKIRQYKIEQPPIFILGYYRSGTTYLQRMFMQDRSLGFTSIFQTVLPEIMLTCEGGMTTLLDKLSFAFNMKNHFHRIPMQWKNFPGEEDVALLSQLRSESSQWGMLFPQRSREYLEKFVLMDGISDDVLGHWKKNYLFLLKKISIANNSRPLVLKNPPNTARIKLLLSLFPGAKFVYIARDPFEVFASTRRFWDVIVKYYALGSMRGVNTDEIILDSYAKITQQYFNQKHVIPAGQLIEIKYEDFIHEPVKKMEEIYTTLQLGGFEITRQAMILFANQQKNYKLLNHSLDDKTRATIADRWAPYIHYWSRQKNPHPASIIRMPEQAPGNL